MIVPEIGVNWSWPTLAERMRMVRDTGAQWVKGQLFYPDQAPERFKDIALYQRPKIEEFKHHARMADLIPIFTPMHVDLVRFCDRGHIKIRHKDRGNKPLIAASFNTAEKVWVSGGCEEYSGTAIKEVLCVPEYPAAMSAYETQKLDFPWDGISSHLADVNELISLLDRRFCYPQGYIEAHVKFSEDDWEARWSLSLDDISRLVEWERGR